MSGEWGRTRGGTGAPTAGGLIAGELIAGGLIAGGLSGCGLNPGAGAIGEGISSME